MRHSQREKQGIPGWVRKVKEILHDADTTGFTLLQLARETGIHPVHLSKEFPKYFHAGFGEYIRNMKVERAVTLLVSSELSLSAIAYECGFADQSHFIRCFKSSHSVTPLQYRNRNKVGKD